MFGCAVETYRISNMVYLQEHCAHKLKFQVYLATESYFYAQRLLLYLLMKICCMRMKKTRKFSCFGLFYLPGSDFVRCKEGVLKLFVTQLLHASNLKSERVKQNDINIKAQLIEQ